MGVHRASHHLVRRPLQNVPLWGRLLTCGGLAIRLPPLDAPLQPSENRSALFAACRYVGQVIKLRATWRIPRQAALRAGYQAARPRGSACPQHVVYASLAALALLRCSAQRFFCAAEMRLRAAALRTRLPPGFGAADAAEGMALPFSVA